MLRIELEHYEKIEGEALELEGKANKLSQMVRANLPAAMQGLVVVPIFAGYDLRRRLGRLWKYDVTGGRYEEAEFESSGSGSLYARESIKKAWRERSQPRRLAPRRTAGARGRGRRGSRDGRRRSRARHLPDRLLLQRGGRRGSEPRGNRANLPRARRDRAPARRRGGLMSIPFYVSPEQLMQDKADFARKGIARGKSIVALEYDKGIVLLAENPSSFSKIGEIYDRLAFAGVGKFSEFDQLRKIGVRFCDVRGYAYSREDVRAKALANAYSQAIGDVFTQQMKPLEAEVIVAEVGRPASPRPGEEHALSRPVRRQHFRSPRFLWDRRHRGTARDLPEGALSGGSAPRGSGARGCRGALERWQPDRRRATRDVHARSRTPGPKVPPRLRR